MDWSPIARVYHPLTAGSIDGTDTRPHDRAVERAIKASYVPPSVDGDPHLTLFVARLNPETTEKTIHKTFSKFGDIRKVSLIRDVVTGFSKQYAFVEFEEERCARRALNELDQSVLEEHILFVGWECEHTLEGWIPRRLGGGFGGRKESGQLRFGGQDRPFRKPIMVQAKDDRDVERDCDRVGDRDRDRDRDRERHRDRDDRESERHRDRDDRDREKRRDREGDKRRDRYERNTERHRDRAEDERRKDRDDQDRDRYRRSDDDRGRYRDSKRQRDRRRDDEDQRRNKDKYEPEDKYNRDLDVLQMGKNERRGTERDTENFIKYRDTRSDEGNRSREEGEVTS